MAVSYRQGCEAAAVVGFIRWNGVASQTHTQENTQTFTDVIEDPHHTHTHSLMHLRLNHTFLDRAASIDAVPRAALLLPLDD